MSVDNINTEDKENNFILYGRENLLARLKEFVVGHNGVPENVAILGIKGIGKTALINAAFSADQLNFYLIENHIIVTRTKTLYLSESMESFYSYLFTSIVNSLEILEHLDSESYITMTEQIKEMLYKKKDFSVSVDEALMESILSKTLDIIKNTGYKLILLFDDFEQFADSPMLKNNQYKYMRELANSGKLSLFLTTSQDLTKVSDEIAGSRFETIFEYIEVKGIRYEEVEKWMIDVTRNMNMEIGEDVIDWCYDMSGGIPELVKDATDVVTEFLIKQEEFDENECLKILKEREKHLMRRWWQQMDCDEQKILLDFLNGEIENSVTRDRLIKKGYLTESDYDEISFSTPLFEQYVLDIADKEVKSEADMTQVGSNEIIIEKLGQLDEKVQVIGNQMTHLSDQINDFINLPDKNDFYNEETGELKSQEYVEAIEKSASEQELFADRYHKTDDTEMCKEWNIDLEIWNVLTEVQKRDCKTGYVLNYIFNDDENLSYDPVTVTLGNVLESILIDWLLPVIKKHETDFYRKVIENESKLTIGTFDYTFKKSSIILTLTNLGCNPDKIESYKKRLEECYVIRNNTDHHGKNITLEQEKSFIRNLFLSKNSLLRVTNELSAL